MLAGWWLTGFKIVKNETDKNEFDYNVSDLSNCPWCMMMMTGLTMDSGNEPELVTGYTQDEAGLWFPFFSSKSAFIFMTTFCLLQVGQRNSIDQKIAKKPLFICPPSIFEFQIPMTISGLYRGLSNWTSFIFVGHGHPVHLNFKFQMNIPISPASLAIKGHYHNFIFYFLILSC